MIHPITKKPCPVPPNGFSRTPETLKEMIEKGEILFGEDETTQPNQKMFLTPNSKRQISSVIQDAKKGKVDLDNLGLEFPYCHPVSLYKTLISSVCKKDNEIVLDFFSGSGTTGQAVIDLNKEDGIKRKYILIELGEHFSTTIIPRIKKTIFTDNWKEGKAKAGKGYSHFFKYFKLEQYEETLRKSKYLDKDPLPNQDIYQQYLFLKDLKLTPEVLEIDKKAKNIKVDLTKLHPSIDIPETLSHLTGKFIKQIKKDEVIFTDDTKIDLNNIDYKIIKPLVWW